MDAEPNYTTVRLMHQYFVLKSMWECVRPSVRVACRLKCFQDQAQCFNKKVLLRERKRHTARRVASARYADLSPDEGGGGVPHPVSWMRVPPISTWDGVPLIWIWDGVPHSGPGMGYPCLDLRWGIPLCPDLGWGTHPPNRGVTWQTENSTFPHPSDAGGNDTTPPTSGVEN